MSPIDTPVARLWEGIEESICVKEPILSDVALLISAGRTKSSLTMICDRMRIYIACKR
jgi:hypothetical protein